MQIVIDIPEFVYEHIIAHTEDMNDMNSAIRAIENGIVLPEKHGDLVDRDEIMSHKRYDSEVLNAHTLVRRNYPYYWEIQKEAENEDRD